MCTLLVKRGGDGVRCPRLVVPAVPTSVSSQLFHTRLAGTSVMQLGAAFGEFACAGALLQLKRDYFALWHNAHSHTRTYSILVLD